MYSVRTTDTDTCFKDINQDTIRSCLCYMTSCDYNSIYYEPINRRPMLRCRWVQTGRMVWCRSLVTAALLVSSQGCLIIAISYLGFDRPPQEVRPSIIARNSLRMYVNIVAKPVK